MQSVFVIGGAKKALRKSKILNSKGAGTSRGSGGMLPWKILKFRSSETAGSFYILLILQKIFLLSFQKNLTKLLVEL